MERSYDDKITKIENIREPASIKERKNKRKSMVGLCSFSLMAFDLR